MSPEYLDYLCVCVADYAAESVVVPVGLAATITAACGDKPSADQEKLVKLLSESSAVVGVAEFLTGPHVRRANLP